MPSEPPIETISIAPRIEGRPPTQLTITGKRRIGSGIFGTAFQTEVMVGCHARKLVIKRFKTIDRRGIVTTAKENAAKAMANYAAAKKAGLKVFPTYRLSEDGESIVMTNGNIGSTICISNEHSSHLPNIGEPKIQLRGDAACTSLIDSVFDQALLAANHDISIHSDAFFFLYDKTTGGIDFVIGDLDNVDRRKLPPNESRLLNNLYGAEMALISFMNGNVEAPSNYLKTISEVRDEIKIKQ